VDKCVQEIHGVEQEPESFFDAVKHFESGHVYSILTKDSNGNFLGLSHQNQVSFADRVSNQIKGEKDSIGDHNNYLI